MCEHIFRIIVNWLNYEQSSCRFRACNLKNLITIYKIQSKYTEQNHKIKAKTPRLIVIAIQLDVHYFCLVYFYLFSSSTDIEVRYFGSPKRIYAGILYSVVISSFTYVVCWWWWLCFFTSFSIKHCPNQ